MTITNFGTTCDGQTVKKVEISGGGLTAHILSWGAVLQNLTIENHPFPLVLGYDQFELYEKHSPNFGAIVGRCSNRINNGRFIINDKIYQADINFLGKHCLHGGTKGFSKIPWTIDDITTSSVQLSCFSADQDMGFPGNLKVTCTYSLLDNGCLSLEMVGHTDAPTICNLAHHSYFNLEDGGENDVLSHKLQIFADQYLQNDPEGIPTGEILNVRDTIYDFRKERQIKNNVTHQSYDHNYCLSDQRRDLSLAAILSAPTSGIIMELHTTESGLQFYDGARAKRDFSGLKNIRYNNFSGICLEPQVWTDAINHMHFPQSLISPDAPYYQLTQYRFYKLNHS